MRVGLARDPRVLWMADYLAGQRRFINWLTDPVQKHCDESAYEHVTRNVVASLCVTGLLQVWGMAREQGERIEDDLIVRFCDADTLSAIADIPCFGEAMIETAWLIEQADGSARLPNFFKQKKSPSDRFAKTGAERQREYRERQKGKDSNETVTKHNVTSNEKVTKSDAREEKSKEEEKKKLHAAEPPVRDPLLDNGAVKMWKDKIHLTAPAGAPRERIAAEVTNLERWGQTLEAWVTRGHNKQNIDGQLAWYRDGIPVYGNSKQSGKRDKPFIFDDSKWD